MTSSPIDSFYDLLQGTLIQPTPTNKPTSTVTIIRYTGDSIRSLFGDELKPLKGEVWSIGGAFCISSFMACPIDLDSIFLSYP